MTAGATVIDIIGFIDAGAAAVGKAAVAGDAAGSTRASSLAIGRHSTNMAASTTIAGIGLQVNASAAAIGQSSRASRAQVRIDADPIGAV